MAAPNDGVWIGDLPGDVNEELLTTLFSKCNVTFMKALPPKFPGGSGAALLRFGTVDEAKWIVDNLNGNIPEGLQQPVQVRYANEKGASSSAKGGWGKAVSVGGKAAPRVEPYPSRAKGYGKEIGKGKTKSFDTSGKGKGKPGRALDSVINALSDAMVLPGGKTEMPIENSLYLAGLPRNTTDVDLYKAFAPFGAIPARGIRAMPDKLNPGYCTGFAFVDFLDPLAAQAAQQAVNGAVLPDGSRIEATFKMRGKGKGKETDGQ